MGVWNFERLAWIGLLLCRHNTVLFGKSVGYIQFDTVYDP